MQADHDHSEQEWHEGEEEMHRLLGVPASGNPTIRGLPVAYARWMSQSPLVALGTEDDEHRIWTTVLGGSAGAISPLGAGVLAVSSRARLSPTSDGSGVWTGSDPVIEALFSSGGRDDRERLVAGLAIDLEEQTRVKLAGRMVKGVVVPGETERSSVDVHVAVAIDETLGNCPKYLNRKAVWPHEAHPTLVSDSLPLTPEAVDLIARADIFFLSSRHGDESMDTNNRGGAPGFVRILGNSIDEGVALVYPEYSGNRLLQTLGNLRSDPAIGITFPDFETGDVLYLTGRAVILIGPDAASVMPHAKVAVRIDIDAARLVQDGLFFRGRLLDPSPYNPPVRRLAREGAERNATMPDGRPVSVARASVIRRDRITPTLSRYAFRLSAPASWDAGQHVTMDFSADLDQGWSHMRDHDPTSLNDDFIRSFTISSGASAPDGGAGSEFEITVREHAAVTRHLSRWTPGAGLSAAVIGFGGENDVLFHPGEEPSSPEDDVVVIAAGVGITPLLAQAATALSSGRPLHVLWSLAADDLPFAVEALEQVDRLASIVTLFVTRVGPSHRDDLRRLERSGVVVQTRRLESEDVLRAGRQGQRRYEVCAGQSLRNAVMHWVAGETVRFNRFDY
jgi:ferredoxin-NADP reductase